MKNTIEVLVVLPVNEAQKAQLAQALPQGNFIYTNRDKTNQAEVDRAEIILGNVYPPMIKKAQNLRWLQLNSAGTDSFVKPDVVRADIQLTNATGAYGLALSEHMLALTFSLLKKIPVYCHNQANNLWQDEGTVQAVSGSRCLVVGLGDIGSQYAQKMQALGSYVVGIKKHLTATPPSVHQLYTMEHLEEQLALADIVALSLPNNEETRYLINSRRLQLMKKNAILINVGRGQAVVTADLMQALQQHWLAGAGIDVTDPEPLPPNHPLWQTPNLLITPHIAGMYHLPQTLDLIVALACENLRRYGNQQPLKNVVNIKTGYLDR